MKNFLWYRSLVYFIIMELHYWSRNKTWASEQSYKYINSNLGTVQIPRLVAGRVCSIILWLFFTHSVRLWETPYPAAVISYWLNRRKTEKDYWSESYLSVLIQSQFSQTGYNRQ